MPSRSLDDLHPWVKAKAEAFLRKCVVMGHPVLIYETFRTPAEQAQKYIEHKSNAKAGESPHQYGLAFDCVPTDTETGKPLWDSPDMVWERLYSAAAACGLDPLGDLYGEYLPWDKGHMQEPGWRIVKDLMYTYGKADGTRGIRA